MSESLSNLTPPLLLSVLSVLNPEDSSDATAATALRLLNDGPGRSIEQSGPLNLPLDRHLRQSGNQPSGDPTRLAGGPPQAGAFLVGRLFRIVAPSIFALLTLRVGQANSIAEKGPFHS